MNQFNALVELMALVTEREAFIAANAYCTIVGVTPAYNEGQFQKIAEEMRALKMPESEPNQNTSLEVISDRFDAIGSLFSGKEKGSAHV